MYPKRITFRYLAETLPRLKTVAEFHALIAVMQERGWMGAAKDANFYGLMEQLLVPAVRKQARASRR